MASPEHVAKVREFNRFYTARLGMTRNGLHRTGHPLAEARVLYELGAHGATETSTLRETLAIDAGQLSRLLKRLEDNGLITRRRAPLDARRQQVRLTDEGQERFHTLDERSSEEVSAMLETLPDPETLIERMDALRHAIEGPSKAVLLRPPEPGDLGWLVERHGALYAREYAWDQSFERLVAGIVSAFDPATDRAWIAELDHERAGAVLCVHHDDTTAKLRTLLVEPHARGLGLGTRLVDEVVRHARNRGYTTLTLWTNDVLTAARRIYERAGFTLQHEHPHRAFGHDLVEQTWSLTLNP